MLQKDTPKSKKAQALPFSNDGSSLAAQKAIPLLALVLVFITSKFKREKEKKRNNRRTPQVVRYSQRSSPLLPPPFFFARGNTVAALCAAAMLGKKSSYRGERHAALN